MTGCLRGLVLVVVGGCALGASAQVTDYVRSEAMIPVRDGVKLHAVILRPKGSEDGDALPFLMERTPYGVDGYTPDRVFLGKPELAKSGYIFVYEDIRGRYGSGGQFVMNRPLVGHGAVPATSMSRRIRATRSTGC